MTIQPPHTRLIDENTEFANIKARVGQQKPAEIYGHCLWVERT